MATERGLFLPYTLHRTRRGLPGPPRRVSRARWCAARPSATKPNDERFREFTDAALPRIEQQLGAAMPVYPELEQLRLAVRPASACANGWARIIRVVRQLLSKESPDGTRAAPRERKRSSPIRPCAWRCGKAAQAAIAASNDPMIVLARDIDPDARALRKALRGRASRRRCDRRRREDRARALRGARHQRVSGRDVHAAPELRHGAGLERERHAGRAVHAAVARVRARHRRGAVPHSGQLAAR